MTVSDRVRVPLFDVLESKGWRWEGDYLSAPRGSFNIERHPEREPALSVLIRVHERVSQKLEALRRVGPARLGAERYGASLADLEAFVSILRELIEVAGAAVVSDDAI